MPEINGQQINPEKDGMKHNPANILDWIFAKDKGVPCCAQSAKVHQYYYN